MKSPCVKDCPDRLPCGACRKSCEAFREYEAQRLEEKPWVDQANTAAREALCAAECEVCKGRETTHEIGC